MRKVIPLIILILETVPALAQMAGSTNTNITPKGAATGTSYQQIYGWSPKAFPTTSRKNQNLDNQEAPAISVAHARAAEVQSLMAEFISQKITRINEAESDEKRTLLGNFCGKDEETSQCHKRYVLIHAPIVHRLKYGIDVASNEQALLTCTKRSSDGQCLNQAQGPQVVQAAASPRPELNYLPYLPTFTDLQTYAKARGLPMRMRATEYQQFVKDAFEQRDADDWYAKNIQQKPDKREFIKTKRVLKDKGNPGAGTIAVFETDDQGRPKYDEEEYSAAMALWEKNRHEFKEAQAAMGSNPLHDKELNEPMTDFVNGPADASNPDFQIYGDVRSPLLGEANKLLNSQRQGADTKKQQPTAPGKMPTPQGAPPSDNTPSAAPPSNGTGTPAGAAADGASALGAEAPAEMPQGQARGVRNTVIYDPKYFGMHRVVEFYNGANLSKEGVVTRKPEYERNPSNTNGTDPNVISNYNQGQIPQQPIQPAQPQNFQNPSLGGQGGAQYQSPYQQPSFQQPSYQQPPGQYSNPSHLTPQATPDSFGIN